jgi:hypothetical protein
VGDRNHNDLSGLDGVNEAEGEAPNQDATKSMANKHSELWALPDRVDRILEVIKEIMSETRRR